MFAFLLPIAIIITAFTIAEMPPTTYLLRVFVDTDREPPEVVTVYRTSKITKYWRADQ